MNAFRRLVCFRLLLLAVAAALALLPGCGNGDTTAIETTPPDERIVGVWRDKASGDSTYTDEWELFAGDEGTATRSHIERDLLFTDASPDTVAYRGASHLRTSGTDGSPAGDFDYVDGSVTHTLTLSAGDYGYDSDSGLTNELIEQGGTYSAVGNDIDLTRYDGTGSVWTDIDAGTFELMSYGSERWHYAVIGGGNQLQILNSSTWLLYSGSQLSSSTWTNSGFHQALQFFSSGTATRTYARDNGVNVVYRTRDSYRWNDLGGTLEVGPRIYGDYEFQNSDEELVVHAQRPLVERRIVITSATTMTIGQYDGTEASFNNGSGAGTLEGTWTDGTDSYTFDTSAGTYSTTVDGVTTIGTYTHDSGTGIVTFNREFRWYRQP